MRHLPLHQAGETAKATGEMDDNSNDLDFSALDGSQGSNFSDGYGLQSWEHCGPDFDEGLQDEATFMRPAGRGGLFRRELGVQRELDSQEHKKPRINSPDAKGYRESLMPLNLSEPERPIQSSSFDFHLQDACLRIQRDNPIRLPWETGFGRQVSTAYVGPLRQFCSCTGGGHWYHG